MKKYYILISVFFFLLFSLCPVKAEKVTTQQAETAALNFFADNVLTKSSVKKITLVWSGTNTKASDAPFYVFNTDDSRFVIIAGDDGMNPVLGYSTDGKFDVSNIPDGLKHLLECYRQNVDDLRQGKKSPALSAAYEWSNLLASANSSNGPVKVVDMETALWGQESPFNGQCPTVGEQRCLTGCGATALAILMKYYEWPSAGYGTVPAYTTTRYKIDVPSRTLGESYQWNNMKDEYISESTDDQKSAVAVLMADLGHIIKSDYGPSSTWSYSSDILPGMLTYMKFSNQAAWKVRSSYNTIDWVKLLKKNMDEKHPVFYNGYSSENGGHFYLIDGYDSEDRFHFNWGWEGLNNGFYYISDTEYSSDEAAIFGLVPDPNWTAPTSTSALSLYSDKSYNLFGLWADRAYIENDESSNIYISFINNGTSQYTGAVKICLRRSNGLTEDIPNGTSEPIEKLEPLYFMYGNFDVSLNNIASGDEIVAFYKVGDDWVQFDEMTLPLRYSIPDVTSLSYYMNGNNKVLEINTVIGMKLKIGGNSEYSLSTRPCLLEITGSLDSDFTFSNGHDSHTVHMKF